MPGRSAKLVDIANDPHINLSYYRDGNREWVSVSGTAVVSQDRDKISELYAPDWKMWFGEEGDPRHGTPDDPRIVLIGVTVHAAEFLEINKSKPVLLFELVKGWVTGTEPELGEMHQLRNRGGREGEGRGLIPGSRGSFGSAMSPRD